VSTQTTGQCTLPSTYNPAEMTQEIMLLAYPTTYQFVGV